MAEAVEEHGAKGISKVAQLAADVASGKVRREDLEASGKSFVQSMKKSIIKRGMQVVLKVIFGKNPKNAVRDVLKATVKKAIRGGSLPSHPGKSHLRWGKNSSRKRKGAKLLNLHTKR